MARVACIPSLAQQQLDFTVQGSLFVLEDHTGPTETFASPLNPVA